MPSNATVFEADSEVGLDVAIKNVQTLFIKIFEINTKSHYRIHLSEINTDITLDGLTPNIELSIAYEDDPLRRVVRHFNFLNFQSRESTSLILSAMADRAERFFEKDV